MSSFAKILVADDEALLVEELVVLLQDAGHQVIGTAASGTELVRKNRELKPSLIITDIKMPEMDGLEACRLICEERPVPIVIVSAYHDEDFIQRAQEQCVMSYLIKPIEKHNLATAIQLAIRRFQEFETLRTENDDLKKTLEDRKIIEKAKGILMKRAVLDEEAAFRKLQKQARDQSKSMVTLAQSVIDASQMFGN